MPEAPSVDRLTELSETVISQPSTQEPDPLVEEELLVEDISIDGMCGVY